MATSAAPTYFKTVLKNGKEFADGGIIHNNPSLVAISEARAIWKDRPIGTLVSLGCGRPDAHEAVEHSTEKARGIVSAMLYWANHIFNMAGDTWLTHRTVKALLRTLSPETEYFRFEPFAGEIALNEHRRTALQSMLQKTAEYIEYNTQRFDDCSASLLGIRSVFGHRMDATATGGHRNSVPAPTRAYTLDELEQENR